MWKVFSTTTWTCHIFQTFLSEFVTAVHTFYFVLSGIYETIWRRKYLTKGKTSYLFVCHKLIDKAANHNTGILPDTQNWGLRMRRECRERFPRHRLQRKPLVIDPGMHHGTFAMDAPWCMSGSLTRGGGKTFPAFPAHGQPAILRIW